jgi:hypothetical protein
MNVGVGVFDTVGVLVGSTVKVAVAVIVGEDVFVCKTIDGTIASASIESSTTLLVPQEVIKRREIVSKVMTKKILQR